VLDPAARKSPVTLALGWYVTGEQHPPVQDAHGVRRQPETHPRTLIPTSKIRASTMICVLVTAASVQDCDGARPLTVLTVEAGRHVNAERATSACNIRATTDGR
jgi:hypothetical protein